MDNVEILEISGDKIVLICLLSGRVFEVVTNATLTDDED